MAMDSLLVGYPWEHSLLTRIGNLTDLELSLVLNFSGNGKMENYHTMRTPLTVYKASAGSGKTFTLAIEYIKLLINNPTSYRNTLAVTFTNKATEEMKMRILSQLYGIWKMLPDSDNYTEKVTKELNVSREFASERAGQALSWPALPGFLQPKDHRARVIAGSGAGQPVPAVVIPSRALSRRSHVLLCGGVLDGRYR